MNEPLEPAKAPEVAAPLPASKSLLARAKERGLSALSDGELIALASGMPLRTARHLVREAPATLADYPVATLKTKGLTERRALRLAAAFELGRRAAERPAARGTIRGPEDVLSQVRDLVRVRKEHFVVLILNARHECQSRETVSIGSLNASIVHPREVFLPAILASAASVVLVHNHPSGDPEPSEEDLSITRRLVEVGQLVGIEVLDHVIVASRGVVSLRARQML